MLSILFRPSPISQEALQKAFEANMRSTQRQAYALAYRLTGNPSEAEDLVQETYVRAFRFFHRYDSTLPFTSWIYRIMTNLHIDSMRRRNRIFTTSLDSAGPDNAGEWEFPDETSSPERIMLEESLEEPIRLALRSVSPDFRSAVVMADVEGMAYEEIAEVMQISVGTVRSRIHRGRKQIKRYLEQNYPHLVKERA